MTYPKKADHITPVDTIVAIATPLGEGGLGVVRLSGPKAIEIGENLFRFEGQMKNFSTHTLHHGWIEFEADVVDEAVVALFRSPRSYTGEDVLEISCHGSPAVLKKVVELCQRLGARLADPGEFTQRAFLNGKMDLSQAEAVAELIHSRSDRSRAAAASQLRGHLSQRIKDVRLKLLDLLAHIEANLDFVEEDIPPMAKDRMEKGLIEAIEDLKSLLTTSLKGRWFREGIRVTLAGRPNVGKSSLFNAFLMEDRAIVTDIPGTTRDVLEEEVQWEGIPVVLLDTAGLRSTTEQIEVEGTTRARRAHGAADAIIFVLDGSTPLTNEDKDILAALKNRPLVAALNKSDKGKKVSASDLYSIGALRVVETSARTGLGLGSLKKAVLSQFTVGATEAGNDPVVTNLRHIGHLEGCLKKIESACEAVRTHKSEESVAIDLRQALEELGSITGENVTEEVLNRIFSQFCIGK